MNSGASARSRPRLRIAVHAADRAPDPRAERSTARSIRTRSRLDLAKIRALKPIGIVLSGGPNSVYDEGAPTMPAGALRARHPGARHLLRRAAHRAPARRQGPSRPTSASTAARTVRVKQAGEGVFRTVDGRRGARRSGRATAITSSDPPGFVHTAESDNCTMRGFANARARSTACSSTPRSCTRRAAPSCSATGCSASCGASGDWSMASVRRRGGREDPRAGRQRRPRHLRAVGRRRLERRGGADPPARSATGSPASSSTTACLRKGEREQVAAIFRDHFHVDLRVIDAEERFLDAARRASRTPRRSARSSATSSSPCSRSRRRRSRTRSSSRRARSIPT